MLEFVSKLHWLWILQVIYLLKNHRIFWLVEVISKLFFYCFLQHFFNVFHFLYKISLKYHVFVLTKTLYIL